jgi:branched-subunit amino acid ABC-type transport system permease component
VGAVPQLIVSTVLLGGIYALIAVGLTLIFGIMRVVNFAHGEFLMLGMYLAFWSFTLWGLDPYVILLVAVPLFFAIGLLTYALVMRGVVKASHNVQIFTTVGLSTALQNAALVAWTGDFRFVRPWHSGVVLRIGEAAFNLSQVVAFLVAVLFTAALVAFMKWTRAGRIMRATAQDVEAATLMGIDTDRVYRLAWSIGLVCVGIAGVLMSRPRRHDRGSARQPDRGGRRGARLLLPRERVEGSHLLRALHRGPRVPPRRPLRPARGRDPRSLSMASGSMAWRGEAAGEPSASTAWRDAAAGEPRASG